MEINRRNFIGGFAALTLTSNMISSVSAETPSVPWVENSIDNTFIKVVDSRNDSGKLTAYFIRSKENLTDDEQIDQINQLSLSIEREIVSTDDFVDSIGRVEYDFLHRDWQGIDIISSDWKDDKKVTFTLERAMNQVKKGSARGRGNVVIYNPINEEHLTTMKNVRPELKYVSTPNCPKNKIIVMYMGTNVYDAPMQLHNTKDGLYYVEFKDSENAKNIDGYVRSINLG